MSLKRLSIPVALFALVVLLEPPLASASKNTTRWRNFAQDPSSSDFTVSFRSGVATTYLREADDYSGVQCIGATEGYENPDVTLRPMTGALTGRSRDRQVPTMFQLPFTQIQVRPVRRV